MKYISLTAPKFKRCSIYFDKNFIHVQKDNKLLNKKIMEVHFHMGPMDIINKCAVSRPSLLQGFIDGQLRRVSSLLLRVVLRQLKDGTLCSCKCLLRIPQMLKSIGVLHGDLGIHSSEVMRLTPLYFWKFRVCMAAWDVAQSWGNIIFFLPSGNNLGRSLLRNDFIINIIMGNNFGLLVNRLKTCFDSETHTTLYHEAGVKSSCLINSHLSVTFSQFCTQQTVNLSYLLPRRNIALPLSQHSSICHHQV